MDMARRLDDGQSRRKPFYAGWRIVFAMFLTTATVYGATIYGFIILSQPMAQEHHWTGAQSGNLVSAMWLIAPLALFCAPIINKVGPWRLLIGGLLIDAVAFASITLVEHFWQLYLLRIAMGAGKVMAVVSMPVIVGRWFSRRFGTAIAFAWCGGAFGGLLLSPVTEALDQHFGWRGAALALSALMVLAALSVAMLGRGAAFPADLGYGRDGDAPEISTDGTAQPSAPDTAIGWRDIRSINWTTAIFMVFAVATSGIAALAFTAQAPLLMENIGYSSYVAATILGLTAAGAMGGHIAAGWMLDRLRAGWTSAMTGALLFSGLVMFHMLETNPLVSFATVAALVVGAGMGASEVLWITLTKRQFGAGLYVVTYGGWSCSYQLGYALGGGIGGAISEHAGYSIFLIAIACLYAPAVVLSIFRPGAYNEEMPAPRPAFGR